MSLMDMIFKKLGGTAGNVWAAKNLMMNTNDYDLNVNLTIISPEQFIKNADKIAQFESELSQMHIGNRFEGRFKTLLEKLNDFKKKLENKSLFNDLIEEIKEYREDYEEARTSKLEVEKYYEENKEKINRMKLIGQTSTSNFKENKKEIKENLKTISDGKITAAKLSAKKTLDEAKKPAVEQIEKMIENCLSENENSLRKLNESRDKYVKSLEEIFQIQNNSQSDFNNRWDKIKKEFSNSSYNGNWKTISNVFKQKKNKPKISIEEAKKYYNWLDKTYEVSEKKLDETTKDLEEIKANVESNIKNIKKYCVGKNKGYVAAAEFVEAMNENSKKIYTLKGEFKVYQDDYNLTKNIFSGKYKYLEEYDEIKKGEGKYKLAKEDIGTYLDDSEGHKEIIKKLTELIDTFNKRVKTLNENVNVLIEEKYLVKLKEKTQPVLENFNGINHRASKEIDKIKKGGLKPTNSPSQIPVYSALAHLWYIADKLTENNYALTRKALKLDKMNQVKESFEALNLEKKKKVESSTLSKVFSKIKKLF